MIYDFIIKCRSTTFICTLLLHEDIISNSFLPGSSDHFEHFVSEYFSGDHWMKFPTLLLEAGLTASLARAQMCRQATSCDGRSCSGIVLSDPWRVLFKVAQSLNIKHGSIL